ncbi:MAG: putative ABC transporter permease, partial [Clostridium baratii]|nr:putative ABC transporter permease [Clostridium baratii]
MYFTIYSFLGWLSETIYCYIIDKKFTYRGFLYGPVCPIYGFGGIIVTECLRGMKGNIIEVFFGGMILASILEYITSYVLQKLFNMKWWDYSEHKFNINGRVCLLNSTMFGILAVVIVYVLEHLFKNTVVYIQHKIFFPVSFFILYGFIVVYLFSV